MRIGGYNQVDLRVLVIFLAVTLHAQIELTPIPQPQLVLCNDTSDLSTCPIQRSCNFNGQCDSAESSVRCAYDCGACTEDGVCRDLETPQNCANDCSNLCGNDICDWGIGETSNGCPQDCRCNYNGLCQEGETTACADCQLSVSTDFLFSIPCSSEVAPCNNSTQINQLTQFILQAVSTELSGFTGVSVSVGTPTANFIQQQTAFVNIRVNVLGSTALGQLDQLHTVLTSVPPPALLTQRGATAGLVAAQFPTNYERAEQLREQFSLLSTDRVRITEGVTNIIDQTLWTDNLVRDVNSPTGAIVEPVTQPTDPLQMYEWIAVFQARACPTVAVQSIRNQLWIKQQTQALLPEASRLAFVTAASMDGLTFRGNRELARQVTLLKCVRFVERRVPVVLFDEQLEPLTDNLDVLDQRNFPLDGKYSYGSSGSSVLVYLLDTGVRITQSDIVGRVSVGYYNVQVDGNDSADTNGHGTWLAGIIGGLRTGVAKSAQVISVKAFNNNNSNSMFDAINWIIRDYLGRAAPRRRAVLNVGFGTTDSRFLALELALKRVAEAGISVVVAAGNNNVAACTVSPAALATDPTAGVISVGSASIDTTLDRITEDSFSNFGTCVSLLAPGRSIPGPSTSGDTNYVSGTGTSAAAAHVSGLVAMMLQAYPEVSVQQLKVLLLAEVNPVVVPKAGSSQTTSRFINTQLGVNRIPPAVPPYNANCGNGQVDHGESCDDVNNFAMDGCGLNCQTEPGHNCTGSACDAVCLCSAEVNQNALCFGAQDSTCVQLRSDNSCPPSFVECTRCGDGVVSGNEQCDTKRNPAIEGCDENCQVLPGFTCTTVSLTFPPTGSTCSPVYTISVVNENVSTTQIPIRITSEALPRSFVCSAFDDHPNVVPGAQVVRSAVPRISLDCLSGAVCAATFTALKAGETYSIFCSLNGFSDSGIQPSSLLPQHTIQRTTLPTTVVVGPVLSGNVLPTSATVAISTAHTTDVTCGVFPPTQQFVPTREMVMSRLLIARNRCIQNSNCLIPMNGLSPETTYKVWCVNDGSNDVVPPVISGIEFRTILTEGCGNGILNGDETCDDFNIVSGDGCDTTCQTEAGFSCDTSGVTSVCIPTYSVQVAGVQNTEGSVGLVIRTSGNDNRTFQCSTFELSVGAYINNVPQQPFISASIIRAQHPTVVLTCDIDVDCHLAIDGLKAGETYSIFCALEGFDNEGVQPRALDLNGRSVVQHSTPPTSIIVGPSVVFALATTASITLQTGATSDVTCAVYSGAALAALNNNVPSPQALNNAALQATSTCNANIGCVVQLNGLSPSVLYQGWCVAAGGSTAGVVPPGADGLDIVTTTCGNQQIDTIDVDRTEQCDDGNGNDGDGCNTRCEIEQGWTCSTVTQPTTCTSVFAVVNLAHLATSSSLTTTIQSSGLPRTFVCGAFTPPPPVPPTAAAIRQTTPSFITCTAASDTTLASNCTLTFTNLLAGSQYGIFCALETSNSVQPSVIDTVNDFPRTVPTTFTSAQPQIQSRGDLSITIRTQVAQRAKVVCAAFTVNDISGTVPTSQMIQTASLKGTRVCAANQPCDVTVGNLTPNLPIRLWCVPEGASTTQVAPNNINGLASITFACGDSVITVEECDDGNNVNGDGCDATCQFEPGFVCTVSSSGASVCQPTYTVADGLNAQRTTLVIRISSAGLPRTFLCAAQEQTPITIPTISQLRAGSHTGQVACNNEAVACDAVIGNLKAGQTYSTHCSIESLSFDHGVQPQTPSGVRLTTLSTTITQPPELQSKTSSSVLLSMRTADNTNVRCAAVDGNTLSTPSVSTIAASTLANQQECFASTVCNVLISGLSPATNYRVFCAPSGGSNSSVVPTGGLSATTNAADGNTLVPATVAPSTPRTLDDTSNDDGDGSAVLGAILGGVFGLLFVLALLALLLYLLYRIKKVDDEEPKQTIVQQPYTKYAGHNGVSVLPGAIMYPTTQPISQTTTMASDGNQMFFAYTDQPTNTPVQKHVYVGGNTAYYDSSVPQIQQYVTVPNGQAIVVPTPTPSTTPTLPAILPSGAGANLTTARHPTPQPPNHYTNATPTQYNVASSSPSTTQQSPQQAPQMSPISNTNTYVSNTSGDSPRSTPPPQQQQ